MDGLASTGEALESIRQHLEINGVNWDESSITFGPWLKHSSKPEGVKSELPQSQLMLEALLKPNYREPFVVG